MLLFLSADHRASAVLLGVCRGAEMKAKGLIIAAIVITAAPYRASAQPLEPSSSGAVAKFWRLPRVEHAGGICASEPEVADAPERPCREAEAAVEGRLQGPPLRGHADPAGRLLVPALSPELP